MADAERSSGPGGAPGVASDPDGCGNPNPGIVNAFQLQFIFTVPFLLPEEAQIAHCFLLTNANELGPARRDIRVAGRILTVHLASEDPEILRTSVLACTELLSMVLQTLQNYVPPALTNLLAKMKR